MEWHQTPLAHTLSTGAATQPAQQAATASLSRLPSMASFKAKVALLLAGFGLAAWALQLRRTQRRTVTAAAAAKRVPV